MLDISEARLELLVLVEVVESCISSSISHVCKVASGAKDTLRLAMDLRRASRCFSASAFCFLRSSSAASSSSRGSGPLSTTGCDEMRWLFEGDAGGAPSSPASAATLPFVLIGMLFLVGDRDGDRVAFVILRAGISLRGESGMTGFRMDFGGAATL